MRIGVLEWASCGGAVGTADLPASIRSEGWSMCRAVIESLHSAGLDCCTVLDHSLNHAVDPTVGQAVHRLDPAQNIREQWQAVYKTCDATIVIAPESDNILLELEAWCAAVGIRTCNSDAHFIQHSGDKWLTAQHLHAHRLPHPDTQLLSQWNSTSRPHDTTWVVKARDGVGCEGMQRLTVDQLRALQRESMQHNDGDRWIVQPWLSGTAFSRTAIVDCHGHFHWLPVMRQLLHVDTTVTYRGGSLVLDDCLTDQQADHLQRAILALPGQPRGWIGVDFLLDDSHQLTVIEINPRLTTSFVGLSQACDVSLAALIVRAVIGLHVEAPRHWRSLNFEISKE